MLRRYTLGPGAASLRQAQEYIPALASEQHTLVSVPNREVSVLAAITHAADAATSLASFAVAASRSKGQRLAQALDAHWDAKHKLVQHHECDPIDDAMEAIPKCSLVGRCLCSAEGQRMVSFRNRTLQTLKWFCPYRSAVRQRLVEGGYFLLFEGSDGSEDAWHERAASNPDKVAVMMHVALLYLSPFRPTYQRMRVLNMSEDIAHLEATSDFYVEYDAVADFDLRLCWQVTIWELLESVRPLGELNPRFVSARRGNGAPSGDGPRRLWPIPRGRARGGGADLGAGGGGAAASSAPNRADLVALGGVGRGAAERAEDASGSGASESGREDIAESDAERLADEDRCVVCARTDSTNVVYIFERRTY